MGCSCLKWRPVCQKRKAENKRKGKAKVRTPVSRVFESTVVDVLRDILQELKELQAEDHNICEFSQGSISVSEGS